MSELDWSIFEVTNKLRTDPTYFVPLLEDRIQYFDENNVLWVPGRNGL